MRRLENLLENVEVLDKRAYFTISSSGKINRKKMNLAIPAAAFVANEETFQEALVESIDKKERVNMKPIDRLTNISLEDLKENFIKLMMNGNLEFSKKYGKELALRDRKEFYRVLFTFSLMDNMSTLKPLMALGAKQILGETYWDDSIGYLVISYFTKQRADFSQLEELEETENNSKDELVREILESKDLLINREGLELISYLCILKEFDYENDSTFISIAKKKLEVLKNKKVFIELTKVEKEIFESLFLKEE